MIKLKYENYKESYRELINNRESFVISVNDVWDTQTLCSELESYIEKSCDLKCRIYTKNRILSALTGLFNRNLGMLSLVTIAAHNIMTFNPDYEIAKDFANNCIEVVYCK